MHDIKQREITETPIVLFDCEVAPGQTERWSTHAITFEGNAYAARVLRHTAFDFRAGAEDGIDAAAQIGVVLANADSYFSQIERTTGFKGARTTVRFVFFDLKGGTAASEATVLFRGVTDAPEEITETTFRLSVVNALNLQRVLLPEVRIQKRCPWRFPKTTEQRLEVVSAAPDGKHSPYWRCGYSAGDANGVGTLNGAAAFDGCGGTRSECAARGMFEMDAAGRETKRFGGIEYVPPTIAVRSHGERGAHLSNTVENEARYNDFVPLVYGTAWYAPPIVFARNDGNLTRMEVLLGMGEIQSVLKVVVNGIEIPAGRDGKDMTGTGWHKVITYGSQTGAFNPDFTDGSGKPLGDPYGSMAMMSVVVPNAVSEGRSLPEVEVLVEGLRLPQFDASGTLVAETFTNNPAWVLLDALRRSGWRLSDVNVASFAKAGAYCEESIAAEDLHGNKIQIPRFECNLVLRRRKSAAEVVRGIRSGARMYLAYGPDGRLELRTEGTIAEQQPTKGQATNSVEPLAGGWPAYEFGDGTNGASGILRRPGGEPSLRIWRRSTAETPNRYTLEFQDTFNEYQQDSVSITDEDDALRTGQEITAASPALGVANWHQAARVVKLAMNKSVAGNLYVEFETSVRAIGLAPGDIITVTYLREGLERQPFRIVKIQPGLNYRTAKITAQIHNDAWYGDAIEGVNPGGARGRRRTGTPRPLCGIVTDENGDEQFAIEEVAGETTDGAGTVTLRAGFGVPASPGSIGVPLVSLAARVDAENGCVEGDRTLYYAVTATADDGKEGAPSFVVRATTPPGTITNRVTLHDLSFPTGTATFNVYRGEWPDGLRRIASAQTPAQEFTDAGLIAECVVPPDENYDHANFYWRLELQPEVQALLASSETVGSPELSMETGAWEGMRVRITRGRGSGQERTVSANTATTLRLDRPWAVIPDATSRFVVAEAGWRFGARTTGSPAQLEVLNRVGTTVHVSGRAASARDAEAGAEVSPVTRWRVSGAGNPTDTAPPGKPLFALAARGRGVIELTGIAFEDLDNTRTVTSGTLTLYSWNELNSPSANALATVMTPDQEEIRFDVPAGWMAGGLVQVDREILRIAEVLEDGFAFTVTRGAIGSTPAAHAVGTPVYALDQTRLMLAFPRDLFGSPASGGLTFPAVLPDVRIAAAELTVRNAKGYSPARAACYTDVTDCGLRTGSGGQFTLHVGGYVAIQNDAAAPIVVPDRHSIRNVHAVVREAPSHAPIRVRVRQNNDSMAELSIEPGQTVSEVMSGFGLAPMQQGSQLHVDILSAPQAAGAHPGRDLTVMIRL